MQMDLEKIKKENVSQMHYNKIHKQGNRGKNFFFLMMEHWVFVLIGIIRKGLPKTICAPNCCIYTQTYMAQIHPHTHTLIYKYNISIIIMNRSIDRYRIECIGYNNNKK